MAKKPSNGSGDSKGPTDPYEVGYCRPPIHGRFKPGQSGNPKGRSKGQRNLRTEIREQLQKQVVIREGNRIQNVTKQNALVTTLINSAIKGDPRATSTLLNMMRACEMTEEAPEINPNEPLMANQDALVEEFIRRNTPLESDEPNGEK